MKNKYITEGAHLLLNISGSVKNKFYKKLHENSDIFDSKIFDIIGKQIRKLIINDIYFSFKKDITSLIESV